MLQISGSHNTLTKEMKMVCLSAASPLVQTFGPLSWMLALASVLKFMNCHHISSIRFLAFFSVLSCLLDIAINFVIVPLINFH